MNLSPIQAPVYYSDKMYGHLHEKLAEINPSKIFILVDGNTYTYCLPEFLQNLKTDIPLEILEIKAGEENKTLETCSGLWEALSELDADRKSLLINLGGGVVTDLGGFVACAFKRGISFINVPTTLLSMVDASVGGKTGIDLGSLKNQIGIIREPEMVLINPDFLKTLPPNEMRSGLAEILKHGLISSREYWDKAINLKNLDLTDLDDLIKESVLIKSKIVKEDPTENGIRKTLNFGHTFGHAIESYYLENPGKKRLLHGEAVAAGMILAGYISTKICGFPEADAEDMKEKLLEIYPKIDLDTHDFTPILNLLKFDKKNSYGNINFVLLKAIGQPVIDIKVPEKILNKALQYYIKC